MELARLFRAHGKELYMVGGTVRDLLLRRETSPDVDLATNARPDEIKRLVEMTHPLAVVTVGEQFGTIRVHYRRAHADDDGAPREEALPSAVFANVPEDVDIIEITTYRSESYATDSRKPEVVFGNSLEEDLLRRDFTINAMARDPLTGEIIDPYGGRRDLEHRLIRAVGDDPEHRFDEDPLRMLRAVRFASQFGFAIEPATARAIERQAATLGKISRERIRDEFTKLLVTPNAGQGIRMLVDLGLMPYIVPEVLELVGVSQTPANSKPAPSKDVYDHVMRVVDRIPPRPVARWAALTHDIAKPRTKTVEDGKIHFFGHDEVGAAMAREILKRLKFDREFINRVSKLVRMHMRANAYQRDWTDGAVRRLMLEAGDDLPDLLDLSRADITSYRPEKVSRAAARVNELEARAKWLREEAERVPLKSPLDGNDLMRLFGRGPGPWLRPVKDHLLGLVLDGELATDDREKAEEEARRFLAEYEQQQASGASPTGAPDMPDAAPTSAASTASADFGTAQGDATETDRDQRREDKRLARLATRRQSRAALTREQPSETSRPLANTLTAPSSRARQSNHPSPRATSADSPKQGRRTSRRTASRDDITAFLDDYLQIARFRDVAPNGMQVIGKPEVARVALGVSANLALFEAAAAQGADLIVVHHGILLERDPRPILLPTKRRLQALFAADMTLLGYHLPLDAHPEIGNNVQWLRRLGFAVETREFGAFLGQPVGAIGMREEAPLPFSQLVERVAELAGATPKVYAEGPSLVRRLGVVTGGAPGSLLEAVSRGCDAFLTGEVAEGTQAIAREEGANFLAAGHYNTERFGVQALGPLLSERFGVETIFLDIPNDV